MRFAVLGTGTVGRTLAAKLSELGHEVAIGSRTAGEDTEPFAEAAAGAEVVVNATAGEHSLEALEAAGAENLAGKVLLDVANPLHVEDGTVTLAVCNHDSLAERIQRAFPEARVVKALNTVNASVMTDPGGVPGSHTMFLCGEDEGAKAEVAGLLRSFGWEDVLDLGGIDAARGMEMYLPLWLRLWRAKGTAQLNIAVTAA